MPSPEPGTAGDWLRYARADLAIARVTPSGDIMIEMLCFHAQQSAEKGIKAVLVHVGIGFDRTHNLNALLATLPSGLTIPDVVSQAVYLNDYAVGFRYPSEREPTDLEELEDAIATAQAVYDWAENIVQS
jgi:HEPN domain-containing protein